MFKIEEFRKKFNVNQLPFIPSFDNCLLYIVMLNGILSNDFLFFKHFYLQEEQRYCKYIFKDS